MVRCVAALALVAGCTVSVSFEGTEFTCDDGECPDDLMCIEGVCRAEPLPERGERRLLTIDGSASTAALADFPLPIRLPADVTATIAAGGADLRFTTASGDAIPHEVEHWDASGESLVWIKLPMLEPFADGAEVFLIAGEPDARDSSDPAALWSDYHAVYHLADARDSTASALDGTDTGTTAVDGVVGPARHFDGTGTQYIDLGTDRPFARAVPAATISAWARLDAAAADSAAIFATSIDNGGMTTNSSRLQLLMNSTLAFAGTVRTIDGGSPVDIVGPAMPLARWVHLAFVVDLGDGTLTLFLDGAQVASDAPMGLDAATADTVSTQTVIGHGEAFTVDAVFGDIDEVRLTHRALDANWIATSVRAMRDGLVTIGPSEPLSE